MGSLPSPVEIDVAILSVVAKHWQKVAIVIVRALAPRYLEAVAVRITGMAPHASKL